MPIRVLTYPIPVIRACLVLVTKLLAVVLLGQTVDFSQLPLPAQEVTALLEDDTGYLWVGTTTGLYRYDGYTFERFQHQPFDTLSLSDSHITVLLEDQAGRLWVGTQQGLNIFDAATYSFVKLNGESQILDEARINDLFQVAPDNIWVGTEEQGLIQLSAADIETVFARSSRHPIVGTSYLLPNTEPVYQVVQNADGSMWVAAEQHLYQLQPSPDRSTYTVVKHPWFATLPPYWADMRKTLFITASQQVGIYSGGGVAFWQSATNTFSSDAHNTWPQLSTNTMVPSVRPDLLWLSRIDTLQLWDTEQHKPLATYPYQEDLAESVAQAILEDRQGNIWLGTDKGLYLLPLAQHILSQPGIGSTIVTIAPTAVYETTNGEVWWADRAQQLWRWDKVNSPQLIRQDAELYAIYQDKDGYLWLGGRDVLYQMDVSTALPSLRKRYDVLQDDDTVVAIHQDDEGQLWLLTPTYFGLFDQAEGIFYGLLYRQSNRQHEEQVMCAVVHQAKDKTFWFGTSEGLKSYRQGDKDFGHWQHKVTDASSLSHNHVSGIYPDPQSPEEVLWVSTRGGGLNRFSIAAETFEYLSSGWPVQEISGLLADRIGQLWLMTNSGVLRYDPATTMQRRYTREDGLLSEQMKEGASFATSNGSLLLASEEGINIITPDSLTRSSQERSIVFRQLTTYQAGKAERLPILSQDHLLVPAGQQTFTLGFAAVNLVAAQQQRYRYQLKEQHSSWQDIGTSPSLTFSKLSPGTYGLQLQTTNADGQWQASGVSLSLTVQRPWWQSWWAILLYAGIGLFAIYWLYQVLLSRQMEQSEAQRLKEMDSLRARLYTNITHEFRTPLTVIMGMAEELDKNSQTLDVAAAEKTTFSSGFSLIKRNSDRLLHLINQLLDLAKLENEKVSVRYIQADVISYLEYLCESFRSMVQEKNIQLVFYPEQRPLLMDFDEVKLQQIIYNLLSNAIKFTPTGGRVVVHTDATGDKGKRYLRIKVNDTGIGISRDKLPHIFDRFYQVDAASTRQAEGTGIGLALTKELVELLHGQIAVNSEQGVGTTFTIELPITNNAPQKELATLMATQSSPHVKAEPKEEAIVDYAPSETEKPILLLVEDNADVAAYIQQILTTTYEVQLAEDGQQGWEKATAMIPDLIISDVMMPRMDGFELTSKLKADERTSHIPVIMLTAKASHDDKLSGLKTGADAYLMKPFRKEELIIRLEKLLELRQKLQAHYAKVLDQITNSQPTAAVSLTVEDLFLQKAQRAIHEHLDDSTFTVETLGAHLHLSRAQLYRKLKAITDKTPVAFIRETRLRKATELLLTSKLNISEIAYATGFSDPNYFSRAFHQQYGKSPIAYRKATNANLTN